jgi:hypothetical protein
MWIHCQEQRRGKSKEESDCPDGEPAGKGIDEEGYLQEGEGSSLMEGLAGLRPSLAATDLRPLSPVSQGHSERKNYAWGISESGM